MLDPLTALSVAGTVVQLTDFSLKLASKVKEIFESADGVLIKNAEYETVAEDFGRLCARINPSSLEHSSGPPSKDDLMAFEGPQGEGEREQTTKSRVSIEECFEGESDRKYIEAARKY